MKVKELISTINNEIKAIGLDDRVSNRYLYSKFLHYESLFIKRDSDNRRIFNNTDLFHSIPCFEMKETSPVECPGIYIPNLEMISKSVIPVPDVHNSIYGNMLIVSSVDESEIFKFTTPQNYKNILNRGMNKTKYCWLNGNNNLIIPEDIQKVKLKLLPKGNIKLGINQEVFTPSWLIGDVIKFVIQDVRNAKSIPMDENPNMNNNLKQ